MNFTPDKYQTRCRKPWRMLDILGKNWIAVLDSDTNEIVVRLTKKGEAITTTGSCRLLPKYGLIPIVHPPVSLPTNLRPEWTYAMQDAFGNWWVSKGKVGDCVIISNLFDIPDDPMGLGNWHVRKEDGTWERESTE